MVLRPWMDNGIKKVYAAVYLIEWPLVFCIAWRLDEIWALGYGVRDIMQHHFGVM